jgi:hypothetical protein
MGSINKREKRNKERGEVKAEFSGNNLTPYGGLGLFHQFNRKLGVEKALNRDNTTGISEGKYGIGRKIVFCSNRSRTLSFSRKCHNPT